MSNFTTNNVDITITYPNVSVQSFPVILRGTVVQHGRNPPSPQHELCGKTSLKTQGAPRHSRCGSGYRPSNTPHLVGACLAVKL
jgi:hypothetical protein